MLQLIPVSLNSSNKDNIHIATIVARIIMIMMMLMLFSNTRFIYLHHRCMAYGTQRKYASGGVTISRSMAVATALLPSTVSSSSSSSSTSRRYTTTTRGTALHAGSKQALLPISLDLNWIHQSKDIAKQALEYIDASPDPFHAVQTSIDKLTQAGFLPIYSEESNTATAASSSTKIQPGGKYFFTKNRSTLIAFTVGKKFISGQGGFKIIGAHTDSPNLKIKTRSTKRNQITAGCIQLAVECYGGGLWHTWFDRDLSISGRVFVRQQQKKEEEEGDDTFPRIQQRLIKLDRPILRIPNLAIHLQSAQEREAFSMNKEDHLVPLLAMHIKNALNKPLEGGKQQQEHVTDGIESTFTSNQTQSSLEEMDEKDGWIEYQEPILLHLLASELQVHISDIVDFELNLFDTQKASFGGAFSEFVHSARLDNLASCFMAVQGLIDYSNDDKGISEDEDVSMIAIFDHEEVGSGSATGAGSPIIKEAVEQISMDLLESSFNSSSHTPMSSASLYASAAARSFILSVDQAHAQHPNYASKHEKGHAPIMNHGMVIKRNNNQRYATNTLTGLVIREVARRAQLPPVQEFIVRNDCPCGSTIGPVLSSQTGIRAIDMGCPQLSMHSIRETMGTCDCTLPQ